MTGSSCLKNWESLKTGKTVTVGSLYWYRCSQALTDILSFSPLVYRWQQDRGDIEQQLGSTIGKATIVQGAVRKLFLIAAV